MAFLDSARRNVAILDGGMISEVAKRLNIPFSKRGWSLCPLFSKKGCKTITDLHREYLNAGADLIETASYNISDESLATLGLDSKYNSKELVLLAFECAIQSGAKANQIVYAMGPCGASKFQGEEYTDEGHNHDEMIQFHLRRIQIIISTPFTPAFLAFETVPSLKEGIAISKAIELAKYEHPFWITFTLCSQGMLRDTSWKEACIVLNEQLSNVMYYGVNCCAPQIADRAIRWAVNHKDNKQCFKRKAQSFDEPKPITSKKIVAYPNDGLKWNGKTYSWEGACSFNREVKAGGGGGLYCALYKTGADIIGGCCNCGPRHIACFKQQQLKQRSKKSKLRNK